MAELRHSRGFLQDGLTMAELWRKSTSSELYQLYESRTWTPIDWADREGYLVGKRTLEIAFLGSGL